MAATQWAAKAASKAVLDKDAHPMGQDIAKSWRLGAVWESASRKAMAQSWLCVRRLLYSLPLTPEQDDFRSVRPEIIRL